jgi:hypothetical protein
MPEEKKALFDASRTFRLKHLTPQGVKAIELRWPSDEDWRERESRRRSIIEFDAVTGEPKTTRSEPDGDECALLRGIAVGEIETDLDPAEAGRLIDQLAAAELANEGSVVGVSQLTIELDVAGGIPTKHILRMPSAKDLDRFSRRFFSQRTAGKRRAFSVRDLRFAQELYQSLSAETEGYAGAVPIIHQAAAVYAAFNALQVELNGSVNP